MKFPFTIDQFQDVFKAYNNNIWPFQFFLVALAVWIVIIALKKPASNSLMMFILGSLWIWTGVVYHLVYFTAINNAAYFFGILFIIQGCIFFSQGTSGDGLNFRFRKDLYGITGAFLILFSLVIYPILNYFLGHVFPYSPTFGLPCPLTIFTLGLLLWVQRKFNFLDHGHSISVVYGRVFCGDQPGHERRCKPGYCRIDHSYTYTHEENHL